MELVINLALFKKARILGCKLWSLKPVSFPNTPSISGATHHPDVALESPKFFSYSCFVMSENERKLENEWAASQQLEVRDLPLEPDWNWAMLLYSPSSFPWGLERGAMIKKNLSKEWRRPHLMWASVSHVQLSLKQLNSPKEGGISDHVMPTGRAREREILGLIKTESWLDPNAAKRSGELTFQQRAVQQAFWQRGPSARRMQVWTKLTKRGAFGFLLLFWVVKQDEVLCSRSPFHLFSSSFLKGSEKF